MLSVMADNASSNDTLVTELADRVAHFAGDTSRTQCFLHIVNLVAKSLIHEFDTPKSKTNGSVSSGDKELDELTRDIDIEDARTADEDPDKGIDNVDNDEGWVDEFQLLEEEEREELTESIRPLKLVLVKVRFQNSEQLQVRLTNLPDSSGNLHIKSYIQQPSFSPHGKQSSMT